MHSGFANGRNCWTSLFWFVCRLAAALLSNLNRLFWFGVAFGENMTKCCEVTKYFTKPYQFYNFKHFDSINQIKSYRYYHFATLLHFASGTPKDYCYLKNLSSLLRVQASDNWEVSNMALVQYFKDCIPKILSVFLVTSYDIFSLELRFSTNMMTLIQTIRNRSKWFRTALVYPK